MIAVPTSVGYGAARAGETALYAALAGCGQGLLAVNIDNGFGAACAARRLVANATLIARECASASPQPGYSAESATR